VSALADAVRNRPVRRAQLSLACFLAADWTFLIALTVFAYESGGAANAGLVILLATVPGAVVLPLASLAADRVRREIVLFAIAATRALLVGLTALAMTTRLSAAVVYVLVATGSVLAAPFRPVHAALVPVLARSTRELVAINVSSTTVEGLATLAGPAAAAVALALGGPAGAVILATVLFVASAAALAGVDSERNALARQGAGAELLEGFRAAIGDPPTRALIGLFGAQTLVRGALSVLIVVSALELLAMESSGAGLLNAALGAGGLLGGALALALVRRRRLGRPLGLGLVLWGLPIAVAGAWPHPLAAVALLALVGVGNSVVDVAGVTLLQRIVPDRVLARVLGLLESVVLAAIGLGALAASALVAAIGVGGALIAVGAFLPLVVALSWRTLGRLDDAAAVPARELDVMRSVDLFALLPANTVEQLARRAFAIHYPAGGEVVREGDSGDRFYVLASGDVEVARSGRVVAVLGPGQYFGEIALLEDVPRTATVTARSEVNVYALERQDFVAAVGGNRRSAGAARLVVDVRLGSLRAHAAVGP
jgi:hypothetical protein